MFYLRVVSTCIFILMIFFVSAQKIHIQDKNFEKALLNLKLDDVIDDSVNSSNIDTVKILKIANNQISSLKGIEGFKNLLELYCNNNNLINLDISQNKSLTRLDCYHNQLVQLDVTKNTQLKWLDFWDNKLDTIDVTQNINLELLGIGVNKIRNIDISKNVKLIEIDFQVGVLENLDISNNTELRGVYIMQNRLKKLDVSKNKKLKSLWFYANQIPEIDLSNNLDLMDFVGYSNKLSSLDLTKNTNLKIFSCHNNNLTDLKLPYIPLIPNVVNPGLTLIEIHNNKLKNVDLSVFPAMKYLSVYNNQLESIDLSKNLNLTELLIYNNYLKKLDLKSNTLLTKIYCDSNQLSSLCLPNNNSNLKELSCNNNGLISLDLSNFSNLTQVSAVNNKLRKVNLRNGSNLKLENINFQKNSELTCIMTDNPSVSTSNRNWLKDTSAVYSQTCGYVFSKQGTPIITKSQDTLYSNFSSGNQWYLNSDIISGAVDSFYKIKASGIYFLKVRDTDNDCWISTSSGFSAVITSLSESINNNSNWRILSNPILNNRLIIKNSLTNQITKANIKLYSSSGNKLAEKNIINEAFFDLSYVPNGIILIQIKEGEKLTIIKVIKQ